jgi:acetyltransferase-like isoleucine patch superfamily enzyme
MLRRAVFRFVSPLAYMVLMLHVAQVTVINAPFRPLLDGRRVPSRGKGRIGRGTWIGNYTTIGRGARIGANAIIEDYVQIQSGAEIGERVLLTSRSYVGLGAVIGDDCVIRGHIGDRCRVGKGCRIAGDLIHRQLDPTIPWDDPAAEEPSPVIEDRAFVGWRALIIGDVTVGAGAYICAGALITRNVPAGHVACNRNEIIPPDEWKGPLGKSPFFAQTSPGLTASEDVTAACHGAAAVMDLVR